MPPLSMTDGSNKSPCQIGLIAGRLFGHYTHGGIYPAFLSRNLFVEFGTFVSRAKLRVLEESPICQMTECPAIAITQKTQVNSELLLLCTEQKR